VTGFFFEGSHAELTESEMALFSNFSVQKVASMKRNQGLRKLVVRRKSSAELFPLEK
jgi:hypothetical protein